MLELLQSLSGRKILVDEIKGWENVERKKESYKQSQVYAGFNRGYVIDYLRTQFSENTVNKMPIISTVNLCKRIVDKQSSIYVSAPSRSFTNLDEEQQEQILEWYEKNKVNSYFLKANRAFKNQEQTFLMLAPDQSGRLKIRVFISWFIFRFWFAFHDWSFLGHWRLHWKSIIAVNLFGAIS